MSENKRVTIPFLAKVLKPIADLIRTKADKTDILQPDWNQVDETKNDFIKNKPEGLAYTTDIPAIDTTLSVEGATADAKATGEAIGAVSALVGDAPVATQITNAISAVLPTPSTTDAGKILHVNSEGKYELVSLPNAEEATF